MIFFCCHVKVSEHCTRYVSKSHFLGEVVKIKCAFGVVALTLLFLSFHVILILNFVSFLAEEECDDGGEYCEHKEHRINSQYEQRIQRQRQ